MKIGSLFSGYGGLELGVQAVLGGDVAWHCENDPAASKILTHHWPTVPNLGDVTKVDWSRVEPVDVITGGSPCQDVSHAGKREGMRPGTRSGLWASMCDAIDIIRPSLVVWENVRGVLSAGADSAVGSCPLCVGDEREPDLRALGRVVGDLSELRYDAAWVGLRAADVGAPHGRFRVFLAAWPSDAQGDSWRVEYGDGGHVAHAYDAGLEGAQPARRHVLPHGGVAADADSGGRDGRQVQLGWLSGQPARDGAGVGAPANSNATGQQGPRSAWRRGGGPADGDLLPTPRATDGTKGGPNQRGSSGDLMLPSAVLLPTPAVNDMGEGKTPDAWDEWTAKMQAAHGNGNGHGKSLAIEAQRLLPTPRAEERQQHNSRDDYVALSAVTTWGIYADAIAHWEHLTRPAPPPTQPSKKGTPQLSPAFSEWLMGLPEGHVTGVPGLSRNDQLKALGNGVMPAQAATALAYLLTLIPREVAA